MHDSIKNWAVEDQPIYKLYTKGAKHLSTAELLAIILQHGTPNQNAIQIARNLLASTQHNFKKLAGFTLKDILNLKIKGIGKVKAVRILAAFNAVVCSNKLAFTAAEAILPSSTNMPQI